MTDVDAELISQLSSLGMRVLELKVAEDELNRAYEVKLAALNAAHANNLERLQVERASTYNALRSVIHDNRSQLITSGKQSFTTMEVVVQLRKTPPTLKVIDAAAVMQVARRLGVIRKVAEPPKQMWRLNQKKFFKWLEKNGEHREAFDEHLSETKGGESITIRPNTGQTVMFNNKRIAPPSVTIH